jgi:hypothetical protein
MKSAKADHIILNQNMFERIAPQKVQHRSGYMVQTGSPESLQYVNGEVTAEVKAAFGPITTIYSNSLVLRKRQTDFLHSIE